MLEGTESWMGYGALAVVVVLTFLSLRNNSRKMRGGNSPKAFAQDQISRLRDQSDMKGDMEQLLVELQELSRQTTAQIETRFAKLEASIQAADERIATLQRLLRATEGQPTVDTTVGDETAPPATQNAHANQNTRSYQTAGVSERPTPQQPAPGRPATPPRSMPEASSEFNATVYGLADSGRTPVQIARETARTTGEIELILALRPMTDGGAPSHKPG